MNRRTAILLGSLVAALAAAEIIVLSGLMAAERRDDRERYAEAVARQRRAAGRATGAAVAGAERSAVRTTFCVRGVDTFVATVRAGLEAQLVDDRSRLDVAGLRELSNLAVRAERYVEQASAGPALPQRMGRERHVDEAGNAEWRSLVPQQVECEDGGDAYAWFRLDVSAPAQAPAAAPAAAPKQQKGP